ncbi:aminotransferase class V-fold PLP-dependent enzyme [Pendulispora brunnea]|uniref:Aminotransferase class V-fold PLP-dependent enzyme n=1 Tax=Pendulispora brunnea TaxID=2905690 RepID=A0ABZ2KRZ4_9BACT
MSKALDVDFVRKQFPAFDEPSLKGQAFFENAGGSYACAHVIRRLETYYRRLKVQPYYPFRTSTEAGAWMDAAYARLAEYLGVDTDEVHLGPSTSQNTYVLAQAFREMLKPGDEIVVTNQDHEANGGVWRRLAAGGITVKEWRVDAENGALDPSQLDELLTERTRLVAFPHCSNIVAYVNPVAEITAKAHAVGAVTVVDGVSWAPHGLPDVKELGADAYVFSLYKVYGPHQGAMVVRHALAERLGNQGHYFNAPYPRKRLVPAGPDHAQIAAAQGVAEYFDALDAHHGGGPNATRPHRVRELLRNAELALLPRVLDYLTSRSDVRLLGSADAHRRASTVSFVPRQRDPKDVVVQLAERGIMAGFGHFYALRLLEALGAPDGAVRVSFVHYTSANEVSQLLDALDAALA